MIKKEVRDFNLRHIFECGQCFRWERNTDGSYTVVAGRRVATLSMDYTNKTKDAGNLFIDIGDENDFNKFWREYLDLERDYGKIKDRLMQEDSVMREAIPFGSGIRILRQNPWEATVSFLISQNNNIPRIKKNISDLSKLLGEPICSYKGKKYYSLPSPEMLAEATEEMLSPVKLGYRAAYLIKSAKRVVSEGKRVIEEDVESLCGVGPKVANCINLFGLNRIDSFPLDVWIKRTMKELYGLEKTKDMEKFAADKFGDYAGIAQQYLFYYMREKNKSNTLTKK